MAARLDQKDKVVAHLTLGKGLEEELTDTRDKDLDNLLVGMTGCLKGKHSEHLAADMRCVLRDKYSHEEDLHCGEDTDQQMVADMNWLEAALDDQHSRADMNWLEAVLDDQY